MSLVLLDTSAYSGFLRGDPEIKLALQQAGEICVNPVVLGELLAGFARGSHAVKNRKELRTFLGSPRVRVVEITESTAERYAAIFDYLRREGTPIPTHVLWIAASAMEHGLPVLTRDRHFERVPHVLVTLFGG